MKITRPISNQPIPDHAECVYKESIFDVYQWQQEMYNGTVRTFEKLKRPDTVIVYGILDTGDILLIEQEQPGNTISKVSGCGGRIDPNEDVLMGAQREFLEESGYEASEYIFWKAVQPVTKLDWVVYFFVVRWCKKVADQSLDWGEKIRLKTVTFDEFLQIGRSPHFWDVEIVPDLYEALLDPEKYIALKKLFSPS